MQSLIIRKDLGNFHILHLKYKYIVRTNSNNKIIAAALNEYIAIKEVKK